MIDSKNKEIKTELVVVTKVKDQEKIFRFRYKNFLLTTIKLNDII